MRDNSTLWIALLVVGGLLLAGLAGVGAMLAVKTRTAERDRAEDRRLAEQARAEAEAKSAASQKQTAPAAKPAEPKAPEPPADATATEKWAKADVREYAKKLLKDYQGNAVAADNKYKDRTVGVVGEVQKVDTLKGKPVVVLKGAAVEFDIVLEHVLCVCDNADRDKLAELTDGQWVALVGRCTGKGTGGGIELGTSIMLQGCNVVHITRSEAEMQKAFLKK
jgi:tRNA_anti-like